MQKIIFVILVICGLTTAQIKSTGRCPEIKPQTNLKLDKLMGEWYEIERYPSKQRIGEKCIKIEYSLLSNDSISFVYNGISSITSLPIHLKGSINVENGNIAFPINFKSKQSNSLILGTDYDSYLVGYACTENHTGTADAYDEYVWILTRSIFPIPSVMEKARNVLFNNGISVAYLIESNQLRCLDY